MIDTMTAPQRRIWWYPTGPLTFVPIHAAGPSKDIDVSRMVISSYAITLSSLLRAQQKYRRVPCIKDDWKLLSVCQPQTPGQSSLPHTTGEVEKVIQMFCSSGWSRKNTVCLSGSEATVESVSSALESSSWVHLACHAFQDSILGMQSGFALHDGALKLHHIASKNLANGQFAFLSACQAATGLETLPGEALHLAAGLQFAGFPSVIASMWSICDGDAPKVAEHTYRYLFRNGLQQLDPSEVAMALNHAILHLRDDASITVDRWASFICFGI